MQSWKLNPAPKKERDREEEGTEQSVLKTGIVQQQWWKKEVKTIGVGGNKMTKRLEGEKKEGVA